MLGAHPTAADPRSEHGFTLIELLVSMLAGIVLTFATFALLEVVTAQTSRATDYVEASQLGRTTMNHIVDELNSACLAENLAPIGPKSTTEALYFITAFSRKTEIKPSEVQEHWIHWKESKNGVGRLYDATAVAESESKSVANTWVFKALPEPGVLLDAHIARYKNPSTGALELFRYWKYPEHKELSKSSEGAVTALEPIQLKAGEQLGTEAKVAAVTVSFRSLPTNNSEALGRDEDLSSQVTFAFSAGFTEPDVTSSGACENQ